MTKLIFGTDGIRGEVGSSIITPENILKLGWAIGVVLGNKSKNNTILIGKDTRVSGYMLESALQAGLAASGMNIGLLGPMPTPAISYLTCTLRADAGIVISASHNLFQDNGIKIFASNGEKINTSISKQISEQFSKPIKIASSQQIGKAKRHISAPARYIERCKSRFEGSDTGLNGIHIVLDCANGANYLVAPCVFEELGAKVTVLNVNPDGFNINDNCGALYPNKLAQAVLETKADCGIAFDGDGDRLIMVDHTGKICDGDTLLYVIAQYQLKQKQLIGGIVGTHMSNGALDQVFKNLNIPFTRVNVGDANILAELKTRNWQLGAEPSGHILDLKKSISGDGIISALQVLTVMVDQQSSLHSLTSSLNKFPQSLINIPRPEKFCYQTNKVLINKLEKKALASLSKTGRILIRPSGTENLIRLLIEDNDPVLVEKTANNLKEELIKIMQ